MRSRNLLLLPLLLVPFAAACEDNSTTVFEPQTTSPGAEVGGDVPGPGIDSDGDGLDDRDEILGWEIAVDTLGFGADSAVLEVRHVTSDPLLTDTDGDGLADREEFLFRTDPSSSDTDKDDLTDAEEIKRWRTSPISVDTDGDATGPDGGATPDLALFDGIELRETKTSPTLADTDGDGMTDYEEIRVTSRSPLVAELPEAQIEFAGDIDMFLNVEYEESLGTEEQYGMTISTETSTTTTSSTENSINAGVSLLLGAEGEAGFFPPGGKARTKTELTVSVGFSHTWSRSMETSMSMGEEYSRYVSDSRTRTESVASGTVTLGVEVENTGPSTFALNDLALTLLLYSPEEGDDFQSFRTLATLLPMTTNLVLGPGDRSEIIQFEASDVNPDLMKEFLARPASMVLRPTTFGLTNADGIDFEFITETTNDRTAIVELQYGAEDFQLYRVATNVERDAGGGLVGVTMGEVMQSLGLEYTTIEQQFEGVPTGVQVLASVEGRSTRLNGGFPEAFWIVNRLSDTGARAVGDLTDFDDILLQPGEEIQLIYALDLDQDGIADGLETFFSSSPGMRDTDGDGLDDLDEAVNGFLVGVDPITGETPTQLVPLGYPIEVTTSPSSMDTDSDGLTDPMELELGTDPTHPDTDRDGIEDGTDECPKMAGRILYVWADPVVTGTGWDGAYDNLLDALEDAEEMNATGLCENAVSEIWVAQGTYYADGGNQLTLGSGSSNGMVVTGEPIGVYGGFLGGELKRGQRNSNPVSNGTVLSGDLAQNDDPNVPSTMDDNSRVLIYDMQLSEENPYVLDGFLIEGGRSGNGAAVFSLGRGSTPEESSTLVLRNCLIVGNASTASGGALYFDEVDVSIEDCLVVSNQGRTGGGLFADLSSLAIRRSQFQDNESQTVGGAIHTSRSTLLIEDCRIADNRSLTAQGGALWCNQSEINALNSTFLRNESSGSGGAIFQLSGDMNLVQCAFLENRTRRGNTRGSAVNNADRGRVGLINCTVARNETATDAGQHSEFGAVHGATTVVNSVLYANIRRAEIVVYDRDDNGDLEGIRLVADHPFEDEAAQISRDSAIRNSAISSLGTNALPGPTLEGGSRPWGGPVGAYSAANLNNLDLLETPFADLSGRLAEGSPCIDQGFDFVDIDPLTLGLQFLPFTDIEGQARFLDGDSDGVAVVDIGAFEFLLD